jgi:hypothetical protein
MQHNDLLVPDLKSEGNGAQVNASVRELLFVQGKEYFVD